MRITCPLCGERDHREFHYMGDAVALERPEPDESLDVWDDYLHNRINPAGETRDLWHHEGGCGSWVVVTRNTVTHEVLATELASDAAQKLAGERS